MAKCMLQETVWFDQPKVESAERLYQQVIAKRHSGLQVVGTRMEPLSVSASGGALGAIQQARGLIGQALNQPVLVSRTTEDLEKRVQALETENKELRAKVDSMERRLTALEGTSTTGGVKVDTAPAPAKSKGDNDDDFDLFGSDSEDELPSKPVEKPVDKKPKKVVIAKSSLVLDVKPWDDETDVADMERCVRGVSKDGLVWGASKILPVAYGIKKLQISCVIEDDKVGTDFLEDSITAFEDLVQSVDIVAFNKI